MITAKEILSAWDSWNSAEALFGSAAEKILGLENSEWPYQDYKFDSYDNSFELLECQDEFRITRKQAEAFEAMGFDRFWLCHVNKSETRYYRVKGEWGFDRTFPNPRSIYTWRPLADNGTLGAGDSAPE